MLSEAQGEPGYCAFYEECGLNPMLDGKETLIKPIIPCLNSTPAVPLSGLHYMKLRQVCFSVLTLVENIALFVLLMYEGCSFH